MTDINHRRSGNRKPVNQRYGSYSNGFAYPTNKQAQHPVIDDGVQRVGKTDYLDKSLHGWSRVSMMGRSVFSNIGKKPTP